jgi:hypothetical protein
MSARFIAPEQARAGGLYLKRLLQLLSPQHMTLYQSLEDWSFYIVTTADLETVSRCAAECLHGHLVVLSVTLEEPQTGLKKQLYSHIDSYMRQKYFEALDKAQQAKQ